MPTPSVKSTATGKPRIKNIGAETEALIINMSIDLFANNDFSDVSMKHIAQAVNITPSSIYLYFKDKAELYLAASVHAVKRSTAKILTGAARGKTDEDRLRNFLIALAGVITQDTNTTKLFERLLLSKENDVLAAAAKEAFFEPFHVLQDLLHRVTGAPKSSVDTASIYGTMLGLAQFSAMLATAGEGSLAFHKDPVALAEHVLRLYVSDRKS